MPSPLLEALLDDLARVELVGVLYLFFRETPRARDGAEEIVGLRGPVAGDVTPRLRPGHSRGGVWWTMPPIRSPHTR